MGDLGSKQHEQPVHVFKVILFGETNTGKSQLAKRWTEGTFSEKHDSTIGVEFSIARLTTMNVPIKVQVWDSGGQARFRNLSESYYRGSYCGFVVFDHSNLRSWQQVASHVEDFRRQATHNAAIYVVGNKCDLEHERQVDLDTVLDYCNKEKLSYFDISCKTGFNVRPLLTTAIHDVYLRFVIHHNPDPIIAILGSGEFSGVEIPPKKAEEFDFSSQFLEGLFADRDFVHAHSDYRVRINTGLLALFGIDDSRIKMLENQKVEKEVLHDLLESFYGSSRVGHEPTLSSPSVHQEVTSSPSTLPFQANTADSTQAPPPRHDSRVAATKCRHLTQMAVLYHKLGWRPGEAWAEAAIREVYIPSLDAEQLVSLLIFAHQEHQHENISEIVFEGLYEHAEELIEKAATNQDLKNLAKSDIAMYASFFYKIGSKLVGFPPEKRYNTIPKCPEWLRTTLHGDLLKRAQTPVLAAKPSSGTEASQEMVAQGYDEMETMPLLVAPSSSSYSSVDAHQPQPTQGTSISGSTALSGNLTIEIEGQGPSSRSVAHDWVLHQRWPWMRALLASGLAESREKKVVLPSHFPPYFLRLLLSLFYGSSIQQEYFSSDVTTDVASARVMACAYAMSRGAEFGICTITATSTALDVRPMPGFELLITYCKVWTIKQLTPENCLEQLLIYSGDQTFDVQLEKAIEFVASCPISKTPAALATIDLIPDSIWKRVVIASMKKPQNGSAGTTV